MRFGKNCMSNRQGNFMSETSAIFCLLLHTRVLNTKLGVARLIVFKERWVMHD